MNSFFPLLHHKEIRLLMWLVKVWGRDRALLSAGKAALPRHGALSLRFCTVGLSASVSVLQEPQEVTC